jgi:hypothetical protein
MQINNNPIQNRLGEKEEIISAMEQFKRVHEKYLPKVNCKSMIDLFLRLREDPNAKSIYTVESYLSKGVDTEKVRNEIIRITGTAPHPNFHDGGTHVVTHHRLDYDILKQINDAESILEVMGVLHMGDVHRL